MSTDSDLHNELAKKIVTEIVTAFAMKGMSAAGTLVLLESIIAGVSLAIVKLGGDEIVLDKLIENTKRRLAELRLKNIDVGGHS